MQATTHTVLRTLFCILIAASAVLAVETWQLVDKDIPVLPQVITSNEYRGFQRFIKLRRIKEREVAYIRVDQSTGMQWISIFEWDVPVQPTVTTGQEIKIKTRARMDRKIGQHGSVGRISVAADRRYDTNVIRHADGLADPDGTFGGPEAEARFQVTERPDYPNSDEIRLSVFISDGGVTGERVATYIYKRASGTTPGPEPGKACGYTLGASMLSKWQSLGGAQSVLGCPTMNETVAGRSPQGTNGTYALFQYGTICTHGSGRLAGQSFEIHGDINVLYIQMRGTASWLGFPTSDEYSVAGGRRSNFEGGYIYWNAANRHTQAQRY